VDLRRAGPRFRPRQPGVPRAVSRLLSRMSISTWMAVAFTVPAALIAAVLICYHAIVARRQVAEEGIRYGQVLTEPILSASQRFLRQGSIGAVQEMIEDTGSNRAVEHLALIGGDGKVIASSRRDWIGQDERVIDDPEYHEVAAASRASLQPQQSRADGGRRLILVSPMLADGGRGLLYIKIDYEKRLRELSVSTLWRGAISALALVAFSLGMLLWTRTILTQPTQEVAAFLRAIAKGKAGATPPRVRGPREMAQLIEDVGRMGSELRDKEAALLASDEQLRQAQRMESVASLAGAMAHDFNNLLTGVLGYARLLLDRVGPGDPIRRQLAAIENSASRAADLAGRLLTFSRRVASRLEPADLGASLAPAIESVRSALPAGIDLLVRRPDDLWTTAVDVTQIQTVLLALCANARDAMPCGGRLTIEIENRALAVEDRRGRIEARAGRFVVVSVADTGAGLDPEVRRHLFEPFVTTKMPAGGSGLGLATAYGLVKGHEGWIEVRSDPGCGTRFTVFLPARGTVPTAVSPHVEPGPGVPVPDKATQAATILAVDDESTVLALAKDVLELHGYSVLTARNGEEALRVFRARQEEIALVLLDLTMPVMGGRECFREMRRIDPRVRVVISSGFSSESSASEVLGEGALDYLQKPYDIDCLARTVATALNRPAPAAAAAG